MTDNKGNNNNIYIFFIDDEQSKSLFENSSSEVNDNISNSISSNTMDYVNPEETSNERIYIVSGKFINKINFFLDEYLRQVEEEWKEVEEKKIKINKEKNTLAENQKNENELIN